MLFKPLTIVLFFLFLFTILTVSYRYNISFDFTTNIGMSSLKNEAKLKNN